MLITSEAPAAAATPSSSSAAAAAASAAAAAAAAASSLAQTTCSNCGVEELRLLHHVRHRGIFRRLCTTCVLRLHPQSFCPSCFTVYNSPSSPQSTPNPAVTCTKCYSSTHTDCVGAAPPNPYVCPLCISPNSAIFSPRKVQDLAGENPEVHAIVVNDGVSGEYRVIDKDNARILLAAAKVSAVSMSKAAAAARAEAERRAKEAAITRKRARAALEHVAYLVAKDKLKKRERLGGGAAAAPAGRGGGMTVARNTPLPQLPRVDGSRNVNILTAMNAVELREGEKLHLNGSAPMEVEAQKNNVSNGDAVAQKKNNASGQ